MSTKLAAEGAAKAVASPLDPEFSCVIVKAQWNSHITGPLAEGARSTLLEAGVDENRITTLTVPGAVELVFAARRAMESLKPSAVIVIGCVIRGDTPHFDYVCQSVTQGVTQINIEGRVPVIFSVLTVENEAQALERAGGLLGNKGSEGAAAAIDMANMAFSLQPQ